MRYFKPELLDRSCSPDDDVAEAASEEWEAAVTAYRKRYKSIRDRLPKAVRNLYSKIALHDARLIGLAWDTQKKPLFGILLRLEGSSGRPGKVLEMKYRPVVEPTAGVVIKYHPYPEKSSRNHVFVLHDEFDLDEAGGFFTHSLLLTDGEIEIRFKQFTVRRLDEVVTPVEMTERERTWTFVEKVA